MEGPKRKEVKLMATQTMKYFNYDKQFSDQTTITGTPSAHVTVLASCAHSTSILIFATFIQLP